MIHITWIYLLLKLPHFTSAIVENSGLQLCPILVCNKHGKALRRAGNTDTPMTYIVSAWAAENGLTPGQVKVEDKSNEITAIPELLNLLDLEGCFVTIDAMVCQKKIVKEIRESEADYVLAIKGMGLTALLWWNLLEKVETKFLVNDVIFL